MNCGSALCRWVGTKNGRDMGAAQNLLGKAVASIIGKKKERAVASLFMPGGTHAMQGEFQAMSAARITGAFTVPATTARAAVVREGLEKYDCVNRELVGLRAQAKREKQLNRRVELNLEITRLEAELAAVVENL